MPFWLGRPSQVLGVRSSSSRYNARMSKNMQHDDFFLGGEWMLLTRLTNVFFFLFYVQIIFFKVGLLLVATLNKKCLKITTAAIRELAPPSEKNSADNKKISYVSVS